MIILIRSIKNTIPLVHFALTLLLLICMSAVGVQAQSVADVTVATPTGNSAVEEDVVASYTLTSSARAATAWYRNSSPLMSHYLPIEADTNSGNAWTDFSGNSVTITPTATKPVYVDTGGHDGVSGAIVIGAGQHLSAGESFPVNSSYTKAMWVYKTGPGFTNGGNFLSGDGGTSHVFWAPELFGGKLSSGHAGTWDLVQDADSLEYNIWYHVAVTFDYVSGTTGLMTLYKNGAVVDAATVPLSTDATLKIGAFATGYEWQGRFDDIRIYTEALDPAQIAALYSTGQDVIVSEETSLGDTLWADVTPFGSTTIGTTVTSDTIIIQTNVAPVIGAIADTTIPDGTTLAWTVSTTDANGAVPSLTAEQVPTNATFSDLADGTGSFSFSPSAAEIGTHTVRFIADDGLATDTIEVVITVVASNTDPVLATIDDETVAEQDALQIDVTATDADGDLLSLTAYENTQAVLPSGATFDDLTGGVGQLNWTPSYSQEGIYEIVFKVTDTAGGVDSQVVTITVTNTNRLPGFATISDETVAEQQLLQIDVTATDDDGDLLSLTAYENTQAVLPSGATFDDLTGGVGQLNWTPSYTQEGVYEIVFKVTDTAGGVDSQVVTITVTNTNRLPGFASISDETVAEQDALQIDVTATDADGDLLSLTAYENDQAVLPSGATFDDLTGGVGQLNWTPSYTQEGVYEIVFKVTDTAGGVDSQVVTITVTNTNRLPGFASISDETVAEQDALQIDVTATDADGDLLSLTAYENTQAVLPSGATFDDLTGGVGQLNWTPSYSQEGVYEIVFKVTDTAGGVDSQVVTITVTNTNRLPGFATISDETVAEQQLLQIDVTATDDDGDLLSLTAYENDQAVLPSGATFDDLTGGVGQLNWTPSYSQEGVYEIVFKVTDTAGGVDSQVVTITVTNTNRLPGFASISDETVAEQDALQIDVTATDADGDLLSLTAYENDQAVLPSGATFDDLTGGVGQLNWTPSYSQEGVYEIVFKVTDTAGGVDSQVVVITVTNSNQPPVLTSISDETVAEQVPLQIDVSATDADGDLLSLTAYENDQAVLPTGATFDDLTGGVGQLNWTPSYTQEGIYEIVFKVTDTAGGVDSQVVVITVTNSNQPPVLTSISDETVAEQVLLQIDVSATDADGDLLSLTAYENDQAVLPTGATFDDLTGGVGQLNWTPSYTQEGVYEIVFKVTDTAGGVDSQVVTITVTNSNNPPSLASIPDTNVTEGSTILLSISASDADNDPISLMAYENILLVLPANATFADQGGGAGLFQFSPDMTQAGVYDIVFKATDTAGGVDSQVVAITVIDGVSGPTVESVTLTSASGLNYSTDDLTVTYTLANGATISATAWYRDSNPTMVLYLPTNGGTANAYTDFSGNAHAIDTGTTAPVYVGAGDHAGTGGALTMDAGQHLSLGEIMPTGASYTKSCWIYRTGAGVTNGGNLISGDAGPGHVFWAPGIESWVLSSGHANPWNQVQDTTGAIALNTWYHVAVTYDAATQTMRLYKDGAEVDSQTGIAANADATMFVGAYAAGYEWQGLLEDVRVYSEALSAAQIQRCFAGGDVLASDETQTGESWRADVTPFSATEVGPTVASNSLTIVDNVAPVIAPVNDTSILEDQTLDLIISATDGDGETPVLTAYENGQTELSANATFVDNSDGSGDFQFTPDASQAGTYQIVFRAEDGAGAIDTILVSIEVIDSNNPPVLAAIPDTSLAEGAVLVLAISATDPDTETPVLTAYENETTTLPANAGFTDFADGSGEFVFSPDFSQAGTYAIVFRAEDASAAFDTALVIITVTDSNRVPIITAPNDTTINEGANLLLVVSAIDPEGPIVSLTAFEENSTVLPPNAVFVDSGNGVGVLDFSPDFTQAGFYNIVFRAEDVDLLADSVTVQIEILDALDTVGVENVIITSTSGDFNEYDNLTVSYGLLGQAITAAETWYRNASPYALIYLPVEGGSTNAFSDFSGNGTVITPSPTPPVFIANGGYDGVSGAFTTGDGQHLDCGEVFPTSSSYTKSLWVRRTGPGVGGGGNLISGDAPAGGHVFWASANNEWKLSAGHNGDWFFVEDTDSLKVDVWYHVAVTYDVVSGEMVLYKDGVEIDRDTTIDQVADATMFIGAFSAGFEWEGYIDDVRVFDRALLGGEIQNLYVNGGTTILASETAIDDIWQCDVTPFSTFEIGPSELSAEVTIVPVGTAILSLSPATSLTRCGGIDTLWLSLVNPSEDTIAHAYLRVAYDGLALMPVEVFRGNALLNPPPGATYDWSANLSGQDTIVIQLDVTAGRLEGPEPFFGLVFSGLAETASTNVSLDSAGLNNRQAAVIGANVGPASAIQVDCTEPTISLEFQFPDTDTIFTPSLIFTFHMNDDVALGQGWYQQEQCTGTWAVMLPMLVGSDTWIGWATDSLVPGLNTFYFSVTDKAGNRTLQDCSVMGSVVFAGCCVGETGDVNGDGNTTLTDLTLLVNQLFVTFVPVACPAAGNTSGDADCDLTLTDLTRLVNKLFVTFVPTAQCTDFNQGACDSPPGTPATTTPVGEPMLDSRRQ